MTDRQYKSLAKYIRTLANMLGLRDWTFELSHNPSADAALATVECTFGRKLAVVEVCPNFANLEPETQRHVLVHELLHVHLDGPRSLVYHALPSLLGEAAWSAFESGYRIHNEHATDGIAGAIAEVFPLWEG